MFVDGACSIYAHRPRTCRTYDCRVFAATGVVPDKPAIAARVAQWQFADGDADAVAAHDEVRAAATALADVTNPTERAIRAVMGTDGPADTSDDGEAP
jgi:Fe-S-cluster containining protein